MGQDEFLRACRGTETPVRIGVVGLGYWGPQVVRNLVELPVADVGYICDLREEALKPLGERYPALRLTTRFKELLNDETIEAVAIATPVATHYELAAAALRAGKHVFVEKPLAASSGQAVKLLKLARERSLVLMPGHTFLYSPPVNLVRDLILSGELGDIYFISTSRVNLGLHQSDVSVAWDLGPHDFSILLYWLGEGPTHVSAFSKGYVIPSIPDVAFINLEFMSGTVAHVELSWLAPSKLRRTAIVGSRKMVVYDDTSIEPVRVFDSGVILPNPENFGEFQLTYRTGSIVSPRVEATEPLSVELADFCSSIRHGGSPRSSAELGVEVIQIIEAVVRSSSRGGSRVRVLRRAGKAQEPAAAPSPSERLLAD